MKPLNEDPDRQRELASLWQIVRPAITELQQFIYRNGTEIVKENPDNFPIIFAMSDPFRQFWDMLENMPYMVQDGHGSNADSLNTFHVRYGMLVQDLLSYASPHGLDGEETEYMLFPLEERKVLFSILSKLNDGIMMHGFTVNKSIVEQFRKIQRDLERYDGHGPNR